MPSSGKELPQLNSQASSAFIGAVEDESEHNAITVQVLAHGKEKEDDAVTSTHQKSSPKAHQRARTQCPGPNSRQQT
eukprot:6469547-Amphidinium_carterae.1